MQKFFDSAETIAFLKALYGFNHLAQVVAVNNLGFIHNIFPLVWVTQLQLFQPFLKRLAFLYLFVYTFHIVSTDIFTFQFSVFTPLAIILYFPLYILLGDISGWQLRNS